MDKLNQILAFIAEADKIKKIYRKNYLSDGSRTENDAEHSWHLALMAVLLQEFSNVPELDLLKILKMILIHDLVEIDAGDTYVYDEKGRADQHQREIAAADRIFNLLPVELAREFRAIWDEFELRESNEARFTYALDRFHPMFLNFLSDGKSWKENKIRKEQVIQRNSAIEDGSSLLWEKARQIIEEAADKGFYALP